MQLDLEPAHYRGDLVRQISEAIVHLNKSKKHHPILICDEAQPLLDETARQAPYQAAKGILPKVNKLVMTALRLAATRKVSAVNESILLDATTEALL